jgi:hypothetical protein
MTTPARGRCHLLWNRGSGDGGTGLWPVRAAEQHWNQAQHGDD